MLGFRQEKNKLFWDMNHETLCVEPWGKDSLRVRVTKNRRRLLDLPGRCWNQRHCRRRSR